MEQKTVILPKQITTKQREAEFCELNKVTNKLGREPR